MAAANKDPCTIELIDLVGAKENESEEKLQERESMILTVAKRFCEKKDMKGMKNLFTSIQPHLLSYGIAKAGKLMRNLIDICHQSDFTAEFKLEICRNCTVWAKEQNRLYLRHMLSARLLNLLNETGKHLEAMNMCAELKAELKKVDNKDIQMEVYLEECKAACALKCLSRARVALTAARAIASTVMIDVKLQAKLDLQTAILNMIENHDYKSAYSYFFEAFENFNAANDDVLAKKALTYTCLARIMLKEPEEVNGILTSKLGSKFQGRELEAMKKIAEAFQAASLKQYYKVSKEYKKELESDSVVSVHLKTLTDAMLTKDIEIALKPYSLIQISTLAEKVSLPEDETERKIAQMILDQHFHAVINQQDGTVRLYTEPPDIQKRMYAAAQKVITRLGKLVNTMHKNLSQIE